MAESNPFAPSRAMSASVDNLKPLEGAARGATWVLAGAYLCRLVGVVALALLYLRDPTLVEGVRDAAQGASGDEIGLAAWLTPIGLGFVLSAMSVPFWAVWHYRAASNVAQLGRDTGIRPGWHVGWWFVPFANLWMPYRAVHQLWEASHPDNRDYDPDPAHGTVVTPAPGSMSTWWAMYLFGLFGMRFVDRMGASFDVETWLVALTMATGAAVGAAVLYLRYVWDITRNQAELARQVRAEAAQVAAAQTDPR